MTSEAVPGVNERLSAIIPALGIDMELAETLRSRAQVVSGESALDVIDTAASDVVPAGQDLDPQTSYWDSSRQGLMSGERLHFALKQLESAYLEDRGYDYEITKHISLRQLNSLALVSLRETGSYTFTIPEAVFNLDFPGHYLRRIKSISLSVPCVVGPYTSVSTTLRLESNKYRIDPAVRSSYAEDLNSEDNRFSTTRVPLPAIATSSGTDDSGMFENLELSSAVPQFDHQSISDVVLHMRCTTIDGGGALKGAAKLAIKAALDTEEKCALIDLRNEMANSWASLSAAGENSDRVITMPRMETRVPFYMRQKRLIATGITILSDVELPSGTLSGDPTKKIEPKSDTRQKDVELVSGSGPITGVTTLNGSTTDGLLVDGAWKLKFPKGKPIVAKRAWMLITMKSAA
ncbi:PA14 domain protein [Fusarium tjaetaba]|uniref:PA14 domain protein n=1 Tax=Fusarium tjaetaba TaxID=1567544 RepID=A0A8H5R8E6_9HYPO|nr:PA14 domain protein [Fusarium tjaetaba]KAF5631075.1 PA14 domain protein [Fusarium tjaetaba]